MKTVLKHNKLNDVELYILTDENDLVEENLLLHLKDKNSDLYKFAWQMLPSINFESIKDNWSNFKSFESIDEFTKYINRNI